jgi:hypothetical protein
MTYLKILPWFPLKRDGRSPRKKNKDCCNSTENPTGYLLNELVRVQTHFKIQPDFITEFAVLVHVTMFKFCPLT